ncbi:MAG TPA: hypothetical protein VF200_09895 [Woeseiaceae bacterium]
MVHGTRAFRYLARSGSTWSTSWYGSAALMQVNEIHGRIARQGI